MANTISVGELNKLVGSTINYCESVIDFYEKSVDRKVDNSVVNAINTLIETSNGNIDISKTEEIYNILNVQYNKYVKGVPKILNINDKEFSEPVNTYLNFIDSLAEIEINDKTTKEKYIKLNNANHAQINGILKKITTILRFHITILKDIKVHLTSSSVGILKNSYSDLVASTLKIALICEEFNNIKPASPPVKFDVLAQAMATILTKDLQ